VPEPTINELRYPMPLAEKLGLATVPTKPLCHYTSQRGLIGILHDRAMWATDANYLNDSQEVIYAVNLAQKFFRNRTDKNLRFDMDMRNILDQTQRLAGTLPVYVASFSEEPDLLSQWRGYCSEGSGFSLSVSADRMVTMARTEKWDFYKCIYEEERQINLLEQLLEEAKNNDSSVAKAFPTQVAFGLLLLYFGTVFKHPAFKEESEWRAIKRTGGTPFVPPGETPVPLKIRPGTSTLVPYIPFPLTAKDEPLELAGLVVGPTPHQVLAVRAAKNLLNEKGVICPEPRASEIPFRNW